MYMTRTLVIDIPTIIPCDKICSWCYLKNHIIHTIRNGTMDRDTAINSIINTMTTILENDSNINRLAISLPRMLDATNISDVLAISTRTIDEFVRKTCNNTIIDILATSDTSNIIIARLYDHITKHVNDKKRIHTDIVLTISNTDFTKMVDNLSFRNVKIMITPVKWNGENWNTEEIQAIGNILTQAINRENIEVIIETINLPDKQSIKFSDESINNIRKILQGMFKIRTYTSGCHTCKNTMVCKEMKGNVGYEILKSGNSIKYIKYSKVCSYIKIYNDGINLIGKRENT